MQGTAIRLRALLTIYIAVSIVAATEAGAATVRRLELDDVRAKAESVFAGEVVGTSLRLGNEGQMVWTDYEIAVTETFAGKARGPRTIVSFAGGTLPELSIGIPGVPKLREGEHYVFFIEPKMDSPKALMAMPTVGWSQGLYRIERVETSDGYSTALVSTDGEPLEISTDGRLTRGAPVRIVDGRIVEIDAAVRDDLGPRVRPAYFESPDGRVTPIPPRIDTPRAIGRHARNFATIDDLRLFAQRRLDAVPTRNR